MFEIVSSKTLTFEVFLRESTHNMQKRWLKDFEYHIPSGTWQAAQVLLQTGAVGHLREIERHFWVALVRTDAGNFETEVIITPQKIKAYACECFTEGRKLMCAHVAASLVKLRQFLEQRQAERKRQEENPPEYNRLTVQGVLEQASPAAIFDFVQDYARRDRDFAQALKTRFAGLMVHAENPYSLAIAAVLPKQTSARTVRQPDVRRLRTTLQDLEHQLHTAQTRRDYRGAFLMAQAMLKQLFPQMVKTDHNWRAFLLDCSRNALNAFLELYQEPVSPEMKTEIWDDLFELGQNSQIPPEFLPEILQFLFKTGPKEKALERIQTAYQISDKPNPFVFYGFLYALTENRLESACIRVLEAQNSKSEFIWETIQYLNRLDLDGCVRLLIEHFLPKTPFPSGQKRLLEDWLYKFALKTGDIDLQMRFLQKRFLLSGQPDLVAQMKELAGPQWPIQLEIIMEELRPLNDAKKTAALLAAIGHTEQLANFLHQHPDWELMQTYESVLLPKHSGFVQVWYVKTLRDYLTQHFGVKADTFVRDQLQRLVSAGHTALAKAIVREIGQMFESRLHLLEELEDLFPKNKRSDYLAHDNA